MERPIGCIKERNNKYVLYYRNKYMGTYETLEEAEKQRGSLKEIYEPVEVSEYLPLFADRLNIAIGRTNRSVTDICRQANVNRTNITHYLNGGTPNVKCLISLAMVLNVSTDWLLGLRK